MLTYAAGVVIPGAAVVAGLPGAGILLGLGMDANALMVAHQKRLI